MSRPVTFSVLAEEAGGSRVAERVFVSLLTLASFLFAALFIAVLASLADGSAATAGGALPSRPLAAVAGAGLASGVGSSPLPQPACYVVGTAEEAARYAMPEMYADKQTAEPEPLILFLVPHDSQLSSEDARDLCVVKAALRLGTSRPVREIAVVDLRR